MAEKRKDSKGRVLQKGEHQRADGTYHYTWLDAVKKRHYVYAKTLPELREKEQELSAGMDIKALQNVMGHSDASITMNVYNHSSFERTEKEVQRIDNVINF
ncbi:MAG: tyrosine-type recombinase/integrase [Lachnospiraceae bacterium]|jgi:integrase|nr:tyrosine-type recombinase/integrase [Lachnospiraceae bacterium]